MSSSADGARRPLPVDFVRFHERELPDLLARHAGLVAGEAAALRPLALAVGDAAFTYEAEGEAVRVTRGVAAAAALIELTREDWCDFFAEWRAAPGLVYEGRLAIERGTPLDLLDWEPTLRALWHGRPLFREGDALRDAAGRVVDPRASFDASASIVERRRFFDAAGYLHLRAVFAPDEVAALLAEARRLRESARAGDGRSWWAERDGGDRVCCRVTYGGERSDLLASLFEDPRILEMPSLSLHPLRAAVDRLDGVTVLFKSEGVAHGLSDLPWHRDCGLGGHSVMCPLLIVGVHLTPMNPETGELRVWPGSWRGSCRFTYPGDPGAPEGVGLAVDAGDVTVHYGDLLHAAPPPTGAGDGRVSLYLTWANPALFDVVEPGQAYNDVLLSRADGRVDSLADTVGRDARRTDR